MLSPTRDGKAGKVAQPGGKLAPPRRACFPKRACVESVGRERPRESDGPGPTARDSSCSSHCGRKTPTKWVTTPSGVDSGVTSRVFINGQPLCKGVGEAGVCASKRWAMCMCTCHRRVCVRQKGGQCVCAYVMCMHFVLKVRGGQGERRRFGAAFAYVVDVQVGRGGRL